MLQGGWAGAHWPIQLAGLLPALPAQAQNPQKHQQRCSALTARHLPPCLPACAPFPPPRLAGVIAMTKTVAREFAGRGITCNSVAPGFIASGEAPPACCCSQVPNCRFCQIDSPGV